MYLLITGSNAQKFKSCQDIFRLFFPEGRVEIYPGENLGDNSDLKYVINQDLFDGVFVLVLDTMETSQGLSLKATFTIKPENSKDGQVEKVYTSRLKEAIMDPLEVDNQLRKMARLTLYRLLVEVTGKQPGPWGILTGIRPTKIVHRLLDKGWSSEEIIQYLENAYEVTTQKASLLVLVALRQRKYLLAKERASRLVSVYIGIPFCPTRCGYCSFPAYSLAKEGKYLQPFLKAMQKEIVMVGEFIKNNNLGVQTIYLGGGTPTSLNEEQLEGILIDINENLKTDATIEFTVEAGRPDSLTEGKFNVLKKLGVTRISINPQTMKEQTLREIGRNHTPEEIIESFQLARKVGFDNINMDIIIGLPGENIDDISSTLAQIGQLQPENLTVHTLALKRASRFKAENINLNYNVGNFDTSRMLELTMEKAEAWQMHPYYLYRQKQMQGQLENLGYAKEGYDCIYNIQMMEERQTVLGLGAGSASKFINPLDWTLKSFYNPKDPLNYSERIDELVAKKLEMLRACLIS